MGFTALARALPPTELAAAVHRLFSAFDRAVVAAGLFKVSTRILPAFDRYLNSICPVLPSHPAAGRWPANGPDRWAGDSDPSSALRY